MGRVRFGIHFFLTPVSQTGNRAIKLPGLHTTLVCAHSFLCSPDLFFEKLLNFKNMWRFSTYKYVRPGGAKPSSAAFTRRIFSIGSLNILFACLFIYSFIYLLFCCHIYRQVLGKMCLHIAKVLLSPSHLIVSPWQSRLYPKQLLHIFPNLNDWHLIKTFVLATTK